MKTAKPTYLATAFLFGIGLAACESEYDPTAADAGTSNGNSTLEQTRNESGLNATDNQATTERSTSDNMEESPEDIAGATGDAADDEYSISDERDGTPDTGSWEGADESADSAGTEISGIETDDTEGQAREETTDSGFDTDSDETRSDVVAKEQQTVQFEFDSAELTGEARSKLEDFVESMEERDLDAVEMVITGYTDTRGSEEYNEKLAKQRAESVKSFLRDQGVASDNMKIEAVGEAPSDNIAASIQDNRRVVVEVVVPYADELSFN